VAFQFAVGHRDAGGNQHDLHWDDAPDARPGGKETGARYDVVVEKHCFPSLPLRERVEFAGSWIDTT